MAALRGLTFDTGALIALEGRKKQVRVIWQAAVKARIEITVPAVVLAEWWRGKGRHRGPTSSILDSVIVESVDEALAKRAGELLGKAKAPSRLV